MEVTEIFPTDMHRISTSFHTTLGGCVEILMHNCVACRRGQAFHLGAGVPAESCRHRPESLRPPTASVHRADSPPAAMRDFHSFVKQPNKYRNDYALGRDFQPLHAGFPQSELRVSNTRVEIYARTAPQHPGPAEPPVRVPVGAAAHARASSAYSLRLARRARYSRASFASRRRSLVSNIAFLTMRHAALGRK